MNFDDLLLSPRAKEYIFYLNALHTSHRDSIIKIHMAAPNIDTVEIFKEEACEFVEENEYAKECKMFDFDPQSGATATVLYLDKA